MAAITDKFEFIIKSNKTLLYVDLTRRQYFLPKQSSSVCRHLFLRKIHEGTVYTPKLSSCCQNLPLSKKVTVQELHKLMISSLKKALSEKNSFLWKPDINQQ